MPAIEKLSDLEQLELDKCEAVIERGLGTFVEVGTALLKIRDARLYRATHGTFEGYCRERWGMSKTHANRMVEAAQVAVNLTPIGVIPANESQARPLAPLEPEQQREVWIKAVETAPHGKPTAAHVTEIAEGLFPRHGPVGGVTTVSVIALEKAVEVDDEEDDEDEGPRVLESPYSAAPVRPYTTRSVCEKYSVDGFWHYLRAIERDPGGMAAHLQRLAPADRDIERVQLTYIHDFLVASSHLFAMKLGESTDEVQSYRLPDEEVDEEE